MLPSTDTPSARILIVDDQPSNVRLLEHTLRRGGYVEVTSTTDPYTVAALHAEHRYDLMLLDLQMPGMSGFDVLRELRQTDTRVAVLVISADPSLMLAALEAGGTSFMSKPFKLPEMLERVQVMLGKVGTGVIEEQAPAFSTDEPRLSTEG